MATYHSYELKGKKLSFANWISNLSPTETPFSSMTPKEAVDQVVFHWQTDRLAKPADNQHAEGEDIPVNTVQLPNLGPTAELKNYTQILRRNFKVSDTANVMANYGRGREVAYQMEKFSLALKRDLGKTLLSDQVSADGSATGARKTAGYQKLIAQKDAEDSDTKAIVHFNTGKALGTDDSFTLEHLHKMTYNLYLANSEASVIMFHPRHAAFFSALQSVGGSIKMFDGDEKTFSHYVNTYIDEFGRKYKLVPNRWMPEDAIYFFNPSDFTQMVLRAPEKLQLSKQGNYQHWMIEMEVGLRLRDPWAAGMIKIAVNP